MKFFATIGIMAALAIALGLGYMVATSNGAAVEDNLGLQTVKATERASEQVGVMVGTFAKMSPVSPAGATPAIGDDQPPVADAQEANPEPSGATVSTREGDADVESDGFAPKADSPHSSEVQQAFALMQKYSEEGNLDNDAYVMAARQLKDSWTPLFEQAHRDYEEMNVRITLAKATADEYFAQQRGLTDTINDPEFRAELVAIDLAQHKAFTDWSVKADGLAEAAYNMMRDMEDVDVFIAKANLSAHFVALQKSTSTLPVSMTALNDQLEQFRTATYDLTQSISQDELDDGV